MQRIIWPGIARPTNKRYYFYLFFSWFIVFRALCAQRMWIRFMNKFRLLYWIGSRGSVFCVAMKSVHFCLRFFHIFCFLEIVHFSPQSLRFSTTNRAFFLVAFFAWNCIWHLIVPALSLFPIVGRPTRVCTGILYSNSWLFVASAGLLLELHRCEDRARTQVCNVYAYISRETNLL